MSIPASKINEVTDICNNMSERNIVTISAFRSLLGKLLHVSYIVNTVRLFLNRLLSGLAGVPNMVVITPMMKQDLLWLSVNLPGVNCYVMLNEHRAESVPIVLHTSCNNSYVLSGPNEVAETMAHYNVTVLNNQTVALLLLHDMMVAHAEQWNNTTLTLLQTPGVPWDILISGKSKRWLDVVIARKIWELTVFHNINFKLF